MVDSVNVSGLTIAGRIDAPDPKNGQVAIQQNLDMSAAKSFSIDFNSINQQQQVGVIRTMFADNSNNPSEIVVTALGTGQRFTIPAYAEGYFPIVSRLNAGIVLETEGGATKPVVVIFFNYDFPIGVWYKYGAVNKDIAQKTQGALPDGENVGGQYGNGNIIAGKSPTGKVKTVSVDENGALQIANLNVTIGAVFGVDAVGSVPTKSPNVMAVLDAAGKVANIILNADGELRVFDNDNIAKLEELRVINNDIRAQGVAPSNSTNVAKPASVASVEVLAANAARKGAMIFNNSASVMNVLLSAGDATVKFSIAVQPYDTFLLGKGDYTGVINAAWATAVGDARITEFVA